VLRERFAGVGWQTERILDGLADRPQEFYPERAEQVYVPRWSSGRVAVLGDTAWVGLPRTSWELKVLHGVHRLAATRAVRGAAQRSLRRSAPGGLDLPQYPQLRADRDDLDARHPERCQTPRGHSAQRP
jgi:hypothetical protein